ncbi:MAG: bifunctional folylpolyglutamate synthase/dihydrofolate synthase [Bacteroidetes bacterium]|nr:MAG: bifunctional folylpolyglutamate synthase/dihydrofolate synthase [Bacteroidota bacterium]
MNYQETLDYLFSQLPMFHRIGAAAYKADLKNTVALCELLDHPEKKFRSVHVAGTNGKGSVSSMLAAILQEAGYKTGLFTSPHLKDFRERIRINGKMIPEEAVIQFVEKYQQHFEEIQPSFFEWTAALAFDFFAREKVEIAIMETGMGGRLDSTNVIIPELSLITNIGFDHMQFLGDTLEKIALEKAGIIKEGIPLVIGEIQEEIAHVFTSIATDRKTSCVFAPVLWKVEANEQKSFLKREDEGRPTVDSDGLLLDVYYGGNLQYKNLELDLIGNYQKKNIPAVLQAVNILTGKGYIITEANIRSALKRVKELTGIRGRWEILGHNPLIVADTAHNKPGLAEVLVQIKRQKFDKLHFVLGLVNDKDISGILDLLPTEATYYFCKANIPRAMSSIDLKDAAAQFSLKGETFTSVSEAYNAAKLNATENDMIYIGGSTFVVAEAL